MPSHNIPEQKSIVVPDYELVFTVTVLGWVRRGLTMVHVGCHCAVIVVKWKSGGHYMSLRRHLTIDELCGWSVPKAVRVRLSLFPPIHVIDTKLKTSVNRTMVPCWFMAEYSMQCLYSFVRSFSGSLIFKGNLKWIFNSWSQTGIRAY